MKPPPVASGTTTGMRIGIDFDNTIIAYDAVFGVIARRRGLIDDGFCGRSKQAIRDHIRLLPDGEIAWQQLQGQVYGKGIAEAMMFPGFDGFLRRCRALELPVVIVSHKTEYGHYDPDRINLRRAALDWMTAQGLFRDFALSTGSIYFESTRAEKLRRIADLSCTHFIDDLEEVLTDPGFPRGVVPILFANGASAPAAAPYVVCRSWRDIEERIFGQC
jgi:hypothetical protein